MKRMLFNATYHEELRVALVDGQKLLDFDIETTSKAQRRGNVYKGIITRIEPSLEACFVDYGTERQGFLPFKEIDVAYLPFEAAKLRDFGQLKIGTELIIQVEKDERGKKGAALTTFVSLPGRYLVLMPNNSRAGGISKRIEGEERDELKAILSQLVTPRDMSVIVRTAALGRTPGELEWDLNYLIKLWDAIKIAKESQTQSGGFLIYQESNLVIRSIRDHFSSDISEILIDKEDVYHQAKQFISNIMPSYVSKVKLYRDDVPLFSRFQIEHQIESVYARMVVLPSGGSIAIDPTEALTAIDVNSAKSIKGSDIEATALATNLEAAEEIARQMRLRDTGGLVVVDFIDMENIKNQREVEAFFRTQLSLDKARVQMGRISRFGLLELSRQRLKSSLNESITISCPRCGGTGSIRGIESVAVHVLRIVQEETIKYGHHISALHVQLPVDVATYLLNEKREDVAKLESRSNIKVILIPNAYLESPHYKIKRIGNSNYEVLAASNKLSYNLVEEFEDSYTAKEIENSRQGIEAEAVVKDIVPSQPAPMAIRPKVSVMSVLIKALSKIFKSEYTTNSHRSKTQERGRIRTTNSSNSNNYRSGNPTGNRGRNVAFTGNINNSKGNRNGFGSNSPSSSNSRMRMPNNNRGGGAMVSQPSQSSSATNVQQHSILPTNNGNSSGSSNNYKGYRERGSQNQNKAQNTLSSTFTQADSNETRIRNNSSYSHSQNKGSYDRITASVAMNTTANVATTAINPAKSTIPSKEFIPATHSTAKGVEQPQSPVVATVIQNRQQTATTRHNFVNSNNLKSKDFGGFEMVSTDKKFMDSNPYTGDIPQGSVIDNRKRHNDIKKLETQSPSGNDSSKPNNVSYQQIETRS